MGLGRGRHISSALRRSCSLLIISAKPSVSRSYLSCTAIQCQAGPCHSVQFAKCGPVIRYSAESSVVVQYDCLTGACVKPCTRHCSLSCPGPHCCWGGCVACLSLRAARWRRAELVRFVFLGDSALSSPGVSVLGSSGRQADIDRTACASDRIHWCFFKSMTAKRKTGLGAVATALLASVRAAPHQLHA